MIKAMADVWEIQKVLRTYLIDCSELSESRVLNSLSVRGQDFDKLVDDKVYLSYDLSDCFIFFELRSNENGANVSTAEKDDTIYSFNSFTLHLYIYGNPSYAMALKIRSRLLSTELDTGLRTNGISINSISMPTMINEFINSTVWLRNDIDINFSCRFEISKKTAYDAYEEAEITAVDTTEEPILK